MGCNGSTKIEEPEKESQSEKTVRENSSNKNYQPIININIGTNYNLVVDNSTVSQQQTINNTNTAQINDDLNNVQGNDLENQKEEEKNQIEEEKPVVNELIPQKKRKKRKSILMIAGEENEEQQIRVVEKKKLLKKVTEEDLTAYLKDDENEIVKSDSKDFEIVKMQDEDDEPECRIHNQETINHKRKMYKKKRSRTILQTYNETLDVKQTDKIEKEQLENGEVRMNQYVIRRNIGHGAFGVVKIANDSENNGTQVAIKFVNKKKLKKKFLGRGKSMYTLLQKEVAVMKKMDHPNVVKLFEVIDDAQDDNLLLVMEYCDLGPLCSNSWKKAKIIKRRSLDKMNTLDPEQTRRYFRDFLLGLDYIHNFANVVHRDIKPGNLLITSDNKLKLADFGISAMQKQNSIEDKDIWINDSAGTQAFLAPETWGQTKFKGKGADIWAGGVTLFYLIFGKLPFKGKNFFDLRDSIQTQELVFPSKIDPDLEDLIKRSLVKNPEERITLQEMMKHKWITYNGEKPIWNKQDDFGVIEITENDIQNAITKLSIIQLSTKFLKLKRKAKLIKSRRNSEEIIIEEELEESEQDDK